MKSVYGLLGNILKNYFTGVDGPEPVFLVFVNNLWLQIINKVDIQTPLNCLF